jgi:hypothetical protein
VILSEILYLAWLERNISTDVKCLRVGFSSLFIFSLSPSNCIILRSKAIFIDLLLLRHDFNTLIVSGYDLKARILSTTPAGSYTDTITYTLAGSF